MILAGYLAQIKKLTKIGGYKMQNRNERLLDREPHLWEKAIDAVKAGNYPRDFTGSQIVSWRRRHGYSQSYVAGILDVSQTYLCLWEQGAKELPLWAQAAMVGFAHNLVKLPAPPEKEKTLKDIKIGAGIKMVELGHKLDRWRPDGIGNLVCVCDNLLENSTDCPFKVVITADRRVIMGNETCAGRAHMLDWGRPQKK
jgi:DNA-binding transcriptional regulator YiaG